MKRNTELHLERTKPLPRPALPRLHVTSEHAFPARGSPNNNHPPHLLVLFICIQWPRLQRVQASFSFFTPPPFFLLSREDCVYLKRIIDISYPLKSIKSSIKSSFQNSKPHRTACTDQHFLADSISSSIRALTESWTTLNKLFPLRLHPYSSRKTNLLRVRIPLSYIESCSTEIRKWTVE